MNNNIDTIIIAPMTTKSHSYPTRVQVRFKEKDAWIVLEQIRTIDKIRLVKNLGKISQSKISEVKKVIKEMLVD